MSGYGWYKSEKPKQFKPTAAFKKKVEEAMQPVLEAATAKLSPLEKAQTMNQGVLFYGKWYRNFYYVYEKMKCPPDARIEYFDWGVARMRYVGGEKFNMAYFRHTQQWYDLFTHENMTLEACIEALNNDPWFISGMLD